MAKENSEGEDARCCETKEEVVFGLMKEMFAFGYKATERLEEHADEFARMRKERMEEFRREREQAGEQMRDTVGEKTEEFRTRVNREVQHLLSETGVATKSEVEELKAMIADLSAKIEGPKSPRSSRSSRSSKG
jgi:hypothetical protein